MPTQGDILEAAQGCTSITSPVCRCQSHCAAQNAESCLLPAHVLPHYHMQTIHLMRHGVTGGPSQPGPAAAATVSTNSLAPLTMTAATFADVCLQTYKWSPPVTQHVAAACRLPRVWPCTVCHTALHRAQGLKKMLSCWNKPAVSVCLASHAYHGDVQRLLVFIKTVNKITSKSWGALPKSPL